MQKYKRMIGRFTGCLVLTVLLLCGCADRNDLEITTSGADLQQSEEQSGADLEEKQGTDNAEVRQEELRMQDKEPERIFVQVTGAVKHPGVYELSKGSRVFEAIEKAGGMTEDAKPESLNQALEVTDGQMIVLYTWQEWEQMQNGTAAINDAGINEGMQGERCGNESTDMRVDINTASLEQLCSISGIGQSRAQSIITYREQNGAFGSIEDIMKVSGIKEGLFQKIKDKIKV